MKAFNGMKPKKSTSARELLPAGGYVAKIMKAEEVIYDWGKVVIMENAPFLSVRETAKRFNERFGTNRSDGVLKVRCNRSLNTYHANCKFGLGYPIGTETTHGGYIWVKISDVPGENSFYRNWKPKHQIVWKERYGTLPEGKTIVFLDRNHGNCDIDNLYAVDGRILREMSKKKWWTENRELTLAAIKWCELFYAMKDFGR